MRALPVLALFALALTGCARTGISLYEGEKDEKGGQASTGALAVLDPVTGADLALVDTASSKSVRKTRIASKRLSAKQLEQRYGGLFGAMPLPPRKITIYFQTGSTELIDRDVALQLVSEEYGKRPGADVQIVGHTDTMGELAFNDDLSRQRAEAVVALLTDKGIPSEVIRATGRGEREPNVQTPDEVSEAQNRRVDILIK